VTDFGDVAIGRDCLAQGSGSIALGSGAATSGPEWSYALPTLPPSGRAARLRLRISRRLLRWSIRIGP
jgi:hypothetical protein